jgi:RNA polymerase sigma-70 factor (ECF subfamily)
MAEAKAQVDFALMDETELVCRARAGERDAFRVIMKRANQRLFRITRGFVQDDSEAEDIVQETHVRAFINLDTFRGEASILTWLTRIAINEANGRLRKRRENVGLEAVESAQSRGAYVKMFSQTDAGMTPELDAARMQVRHVLEHAIDDLPDDFRVVFTMRDVEGCSIAEAATTPGVREETIKTRLHRARRLLRAAISERLASSVTEAFMFMGARCERMSENVLAALAMRR